MEAALRSCWKGIDIGKILVHRSHTLRKNSTAAGTTTPPQQEAHAPSGHEVSSHPSPDKHGNVHLPVSSPIARDVNGNYYRRNLCVFLRHCSAFSDIL